MLSDVLDFRFYLFYCNLKEKGRIRTKVNRKIKKIICEISITVILTSQKLVSVGPEQQKLKLPSP